MSCYLNKNPMQHTLWHFYFGNIGKCTQQVYKLPKYLKLCIMQAIMYKGNSLDNSATNHSHVIFNHSPKERSALTAVHCSFFGNAKEKRGAGLLVVKLHPLIMTIVKQKYLSEYPDSQISGKNWPLTIGLYYVSVMSKGTPLINSVIKWSWENKYQPPFKNSGQNPGKYVCILAFALPTILLLWKSTCMPIHLHTCLNVPTWFD